LALLFNADFEARDDAVMLPLAGAAAGFGAGATVVRGADVLLLVRHAGRALLYHLVQSVVVALLVVVVFTAPGDDPAFVCAPAARHARGRSRDTAAS